MGNYTGGVYRRSFKTLAFEGVVINNPMFYLIPEMMSGQNPGQSPTGSIIREDRALPDVILGMAELNQLHVFISYAEKKVYISNSGAPAPAAPAQ